MTSSQRELTIFVWIHSAIGIALAIGVLWAATFKQSVPYAAGLFICGVLWAFMFFPLGKKARTLGLKDRREPAALPRWFPALLAVGQLLNVAWWSVGQMGWVIIPANFLAGVTIALHWIACNGLHLPVNRKSWGTILLILAVGTVWNVMAPFLLSPFLRIR